MLVLEISFIKPYVLSVKPQILLCCPLKQCSDAYFKGTYKTSSNFVSVKVAGYKQA